MGFAEQATNWAAIDLHKAVMPRICEALHRPIREVHPDVANAMAAKTDLLLSGVAVDEFARVTIKSEASKLYEASPWVADRRFAEIVRPAPVQMGKLCESSVRGSVLNSTHSSERRQEETVEGHFKTGDNFCSQDWRGTSPRRSSRP